MKSLLDPTTFRYTKADDTDIRKLFDRVRAEQAKRPMTREDEVIAKFRAGLYPVYIK